MVTMQCFWNMWLWNDMLNTDNVTLRSPPTCTHCPPKKNDSISYFGKCQIMTYIYRWQSPAEDTGIMRLALQEQGKEIVWQFYRSTKTAERGGLGWVDWSTKSSLWRPLFASNFLLTVSVGLLMGTNIPYRFVLINVKSHENNKWP